MYKFYFLALALFVLLPGARGQTPSVTINATDMQWKTCVDAAFSLPVDISGQFGGKNKFTVQVRSAYTQAAIAEIPATRVGNSLELAFTNAKLYETPAVQLRVLTSEPKTESPWLETTFNVYSKGNVRMNSRAFSDTLNLYDEYDILISGYTTSDANLTMNDSSVISIASNAGTFSLFSHLQVDRDSAYSIAHAENGCGSMATSGQVRPVVNKTSIKTLAVDPQITCENSEVKVSFSVAGSALTTQTKYKIRFSDVNSNDTKPNSVDVPAQLIDGYLVARFPEHFNIKNSEEFVAQVVTGNPALVASPTLQRFVVHARPSATFGSAGETVNAGDPASVNVNISGMPPLTLELSDGSTASASYGGAVSFTFFPDQTATYKVKSLSTGCQNNNLKKTNVFEIKVNPGIKFANTANREIFCAGTKASIKFKSNAALTNITQFWIDAKSLYNADHFQYPATRSGDNLEFVVPQRPEGYDGFEYKIVTANPALISNGTQLISMQTTPGIIFREHNIYEYQVPGNARFTYVLQGGSPYELETPEGKILNLDSNGEHNYPFFLKENREFKFKSVSNSCFKNDDLPAKSFKIVQTGAPAISVEPIKAIVCGKDSIEVTFQKFGTFNAGNKFTIQGYHNCCDYQTLATVENAGTFKVKIAAEQYSYNSSIRIASTSPVMISEPQNFVIQLLPEQIRLYPEGTLEIPITSLPNQPFSQLSITTEKGIPATVEYVHNGENKTFVNPADYSTMIPIKMAPGKVNEFVIKSVSNECGTVPVNLKSYVYALPYQISLPTIGYEGMYCVGGPITAAFGTMDTTSTKATFSLQISKKGTNEFVTIGTIPNGRIINTRIPASTEIGEYKMRISSSDGVISNEREIRIGSVPTATLGISSEPITTGPYQNVPIPLKLTGGPHWIVIFENNVKQVFFDSESTRELNPVSGGQFFVKSVSNICGYGTASRTVTVEVEPSLTVNSNAVNACEGGTFPVTYAVLGDANLSDDYIRFELVNLSDSTTQVLDSTKIVSGTKTLKLPDILKPSLYEIRVVVKKYGLSSTLNVGVMRKPGAILRGNTTINSGESTYLIVQNTQDNNGQADIILSDGTKGDLFGQAGDFSYIQVSPKQTTTYTIQSVTNSCGAGAISGTATVEVNTPSDRAVTVTGVDGFGTCAGSEITVSYAVTGSLSAGNLMTIQISDSTGRNFRDIQTTGRFSPLKGIIPAELPDGKLYRIRVRATDMGVNSGAYGEPIHVAKMAKARFAESSVIYDGISNPSITVLLEGTAPWQFQYGTDEANYVVETNDATNVIELFQASPNKEYKLYSVSSSCGTGILNAPFTVRVEVITATEDPLSDENVIIYPNPSQDIITLKFDHAAKRNVILYDLNGKVIHKVATERREERIDIGKFPFGLYMIKVGEKGKALKVVKN